MTLRNRWPAVVLAALSLAWTVLAIHQAPELSRYDEWTYIDYARSVSQGRIPAQGDALLPATLNDWSCRGMEGAIRGVVVPPCGGNAPATAFPYGGENYNSFHPPIYFAVVGVGARGLTALGMDFVDAARLLSGLIVALGAVALYGALRSWDLSRLGAFGGSLIALSTPGIAASAAIVHNDAATLLCSAAAVWCAGRFFTRRDLRPLAPCLLLALMMCTRAVSATATLGVFAVVALGIAWPSVSGGLDRRASARLVAWGAIATVVPYVAWSAWQGSRTPAGYVAAIDGYSTTSFSWEDAGKVLASVLDGWGLTDPRTDFYLQPGLRSPVTMVWAAVLYAAYLAVMIWGICQMASAARRARWAGLLAGPVTSAGFVQVRELVTNHAFFRTVSGRYALSNVGMHVAALVTLAASRRRQWCVVAFGAIGYSAMLVGTL